MHPTISPSFSCAWFLTPQGLCIIHALGVTSSVNTIHTPASAGSYKGNSHPSQPVCHLHAGFVSLISVWAEQQNSRTFSGEIPVHCRDRKPTLISVLSVKKSAWCIQSILKRTYKIYNFLMCTLNTAVHKKINIHFNYCFKYKFRWELRINVYSIISWIKLWLYHWCYWWLKLQFRVW